MGTGTALRTCSFPSEVFAVKRVVQKRDAHFVGGLLAPRRCFRRRVRVAAIMYRVIVGRGHLDTGAFREGNGLLVKVGRLPVEVPVGNRNQRDFCAVRHEGRERHFAA